jgi:hypothetical protein
MFVTNNEKKIGRQYQKRRNICEHQDSSISVLMTVLKRSRLTSYALFTVGLVKMKS